MTRPRLRTILVVAAVVGSAGIALSTVAAAQSSVQISSVSVASNETVTGQPVTVETTISNVGNANGTVEITDIYLRTTGGTEGHGRIENVGSVSPGGSVTIPMTTTFDSAGEKRLTAHVVVRDESGNHHSYEYPVYIDVEEPTVKAGLSTNPSDNRSDRVEVALTNFGNTELSNVEVAATADGEAIDRQFLFDVAPGSSQSAVFDASNVSSDSVTFTASYEAAGRNYTTERTTTLNSIREVPGEIRLTSVRATRTGTGVTIEGDAANVGGTDTQSVTVRVPDTEGVSPASPSGEYFIGAIDASEFATFDLSAEVESGTSTVPVEISYIVDGDRVTTTQDVDVGSGGSSGAAGGQGMSGVDGQNPADGPDGPEGQAGSGGLPLIPIGVVVALVVVGVVVYRWKR